MNEQFQHLKELFHEVPQKPSTHQDIETTVLKILSVNQIPVFLHLIKCLQQSRVDLISQHYPCFQDFWFKLKPWLGPRKPKTLKDQCFRILVNLVVLHRPPSNPPPAPHESLFEDIFKTVYLVKDPSFIPTKVRFFKQLYEKKKIFDIVGLVQALLEIIVHHFNTLRRYNQKGMSNTSSSKKKGRDQSSLPVDRNVHQEALEFLKTLFQNEKMSSEEHFNDIIKAFSQYIVQFKIEELFASLFVFLQKPELRIPHRGYIHLCTMLCQSVNFNESFCSKSTEVMRFLIRKNPYIFSILIDLLNYSPFVTYYRGAVFFIGVFSWGRFAMKELSEFRIMTLKVMYKVLSVNDQPLNFEIILSLKRLILNFGNTMILEWEIIFKILKKMKKLFVMGKSMEEAQSTNRSFIQMNQRLKKEVRSCVKVVFDLYRSQKFLGGEDKILKLMLYYRPEFSDDTQFSKFLIEHIPCSPAQSKQWEDNLKLLMLEFFRNEDNVIIKLQVLEIVKNLLNNYAALFATEILKIVMPFLKEEKRDYTLYFLIWMADKLPLSSKKFILICSTLNHMLINETIYESHPSVHANSPIEPPPSNSTFFPKKKKKGRKGSLTHAVSSSSSSSSSSTPKKGGSQSSSSSSTPSSSSKSRDGKSSSSPLPSGSPYKQGGQKQILHVISRRGKIMRDGTKLKLMNGMVQIFLNNFDRSPVIKSKIMFNFILKFLPHLPVPLLREMLNVFLRFRATPIAQLKIGDKISPYLYVHHSSSSAPGMSSHQTDIELQRSGYVPARRLSCEVDLSKLLEILWNLVLVKDDVEILYLILKILLNFLRNFYIVKDFSVEKLIYIVTSFVQKKLLGTSLDSHLPGLVLSPTPPYGGGGSGLPHKSKLEGSISDRRASPKTLRLVLPLMDVLRMLIGFVANKTTLSRAARTEFVKLILSLSAPEVQTRLCFDQRIEFQERYLNVLYFLVSELPEDLVPQFLSLQKYLAGLKPIYSVVILKLRLLHCLHHLFPLLMRHQRLFYPKRRFQKTAVPVVETILDMITPYICKSKYSYFIRSLAYTSLMSWFLRCNFASRKRILRKCFPILYIEFAREKSRLAESFLDFLIKYTYINCEQKFEMNRTLKEQFRDQDYRAWSLGNGILTAQVGKFGYVLLRHRRPTGNVAWTMKLVNTVHVYNLMEGMGSRMIQNRLLEDNHHDGFEHLSREEEKSLRLDLSYLLHKRKQDMPLGVGGISSAASSLTSSGGKSESYGALSARSLSLPSEEDLSFQEELFDTFSSHTDPRYHHHHHHHHHSHLHHHMSSRRRRSIEKGIGIPPIHPPPHHQQQRRRKKTKQHQQHQQKKIKSNNIGQGVGKRKKISPRKKKKRLLDDDDNLEDQEDPEEQEDEDDDIVDNNNNREVEDDQMMHHGLNGEDDDLLIEEQYNRQKRRSEIEDDEDEEEEFFLPMEENIKENVFAIQSTNLLSQNDHQRIINNQSRRQEKKQKQSLSSSKSNEKSKKSVLSPSSTFVNGNSSSSGGGGSRRSYHRNNAPKKDDTLSYLLREAATSSPVLTNQQKKLQQQQQKMNSMNRDDEEEESEEESDGEESEEEEEKKKISGRRRKDDQEEEEEERRISGSYDDDDDDEEDEDWKRRRRRKRINKKKKKKNKGRQGRANLPLTSSGSSIDTFGGSSTTTTTNSTLASHLQSNNSTENVPSKISQLSVLHPNFPYLFLRHWTFLSQEPPQGLRVCPELTMSLNAFDFTPCHEIYRVGVLFVDKGQGRDEAQVFLNSFGTPRYLSFLQHLGEVVFLKKVDEMYAGGLDVTSERKDGKYAIIFKDEISHMVFHVATMMPNDQQIKNQKKLTRGDGLVHLVGELEEQEEEMEEDEGENNEDLLIKPKKQITYHRKKSLIGNDYVVIIYNENDHPTSYKPQSKVSSTICKSEVNFIEIVIHPLERGYNIIQLRIRKEKLRGILSFFPLEQIVSDRSLPRVVRNYTRLSCMAINAFNKKQKDYESVWSERINITNRIKSRFTRKIKKRSNNQSQADLDLQKEINDFFLDD